MSSGRSNDSTFVTTNSHLAPPLPLSENHHVVAGAVSPNASRVENIASVSLRMVDRSRFLEFHSPFIDPVLKSYDLPAFVESFRSNPDRDAWFRSFEADKGFSHVIGDLFAKASGYEGWVSFASFSTLYNMMSYYKETLPKSEQIEFDRFERVLHLVKSSREALGQRPNMSIEKYSADLARTIEALPIGQNLLVPTGYIMPTGGHATLLEIVKTSNSPMKFSLYYYNTGEGAEASGRLIKDVVKNRFKRIAFEEVPASVILTGKDKSSWLCAMLEPDWIQERPSDGQQYDMEVVHKIVFPAIAPYFREENLPCYFSAQASGTCAWRCLMAWLHLQLDEKSYKKFVTWQKAHVLLVGYAQWLEQCHPGSSPQLTQETNLKIEDYAKLPSSQLRLLEMASSELQHHVRGRLRKHVADANEIPSEYKQGFLIAHSVKNFVHRLYDFLALQKIALNQIDLNTPVNLADEALKPNRSINRPQLQKYQHVSQKLQLNLPRFGAQSITNTLAQVVSQARKAIYECAPEHGNIALCRWVIEEMPALASCQLWPASLDNLEQLHALNNAIIGHGIAINLNWGSPWTLAASGKLLCLVHHMACRLSDQHLNESAKGLFARQKFINLPREFFKDRYALILDGNLKQAFDEACKYWDSYSSPGSDFDTQANSYYSSIDLSSNGTHPQVVFWHQWIENLNPLAAKQAYNILAPRSQKVAALMGPRSTHTSGHPAYPITMFRQAFCATRLFANWTLSSIYSRQNVSNKQIGSLIVEEPSTSIIFSMEPRGDQNYGYRIAIEASSTNISSFSGTLRSKEAFWKLTAPYSELVERTEVFERTTATPEELPIINFQSRTSNTDQYLTLVLQRGLTEPLQNPSLLIYYLKDRLNKIEADDKGSSNLREVLFLSLFKTTQIQDSTNGFESALAQNLKNPAFINQLKSFFKEAFTHYIERQAGGEPSHEVCMFLSMMAACCRYVALRSSQPNDSHLDLIKDISPEAISYLTNKISEKTDPSIRFQSHLMSVLIHILDADNSSQSSVEALTHWMKYNSLKGKIAEKDRLEWLQHLVCSEFYYTLPRIISNLSQKEIHQIARNVFGTYISEAYTPSMWAKMENNTATYQAKLPNRQSYLIIDFTQGTIANEMGVITSGTKPEWFKTALFRDIFGESEPQFMIAGQYCLLSYKGVFFKSLFSSYYKLDETLQIQDPDSGAWLFYAPTHSLTKGLPTTFAKRFWFFYSKEDDQLVGFSRNEMKKTAFVNQQGAFVGDRRVFKMDAASKGHNHSSPALQLQNAFSQFGFLSEDMLGMFSLSESSKTRLVAEIEKPEFVEIEEIGTSDEVRRSLFLPRFQSWGGTKLRFHLNNDLWYYGHSKYYIDTSTDQPALVGRIRQYVSLINDKGERLILLPICHWENKGEALGSDLTAEIYEIDGESNASLDGTIHFIEYHVSSDGQLNGSSLEAKLYLAMVWYLQKQFKNAFEMIEALPSKDLSTKAIKEIVKQTATHANENKDFGPDSVTCLVALFSKTSIVLKDLILEEKERFGGKSPTQEWMLKVYEHYVRVFDRLPVDMRLSGAHELDFARFVQNMGLSEVALSRIDLLLNSNVESDWTAQPQRLQTTQSTFVKGFQNFSPYFVWGYESAGVSPSIGRLTAKHETDGSFIDKKWASLLLEIPQATPETLQHFKVFIQVQASVGKLNPQFLSLFAMLVCCEESRENGLPLITEVEYQDIYKHLKIIAGRTSINSCVPKYLSEKEDDYDGRLRAFRREFNEKLLPAVYEKVKSNLPSILGFSSVSSYSTVRERAPIHGHHTIDWYQSPNLWSQLHHVHFQEPSFAPSELSQLFKLTPFEKLHLDEEQACAQPLKDSEKAAVEQENALFLEDLQEGQRKIEERSHIELNTEKVGKFIPQAHKAMKNLKDSSKNLESRICDLLNKLPTEASAALLQEIAGRDHGAKKVYGMQDAVFFFLKGQKNAFFEANPLLTQKEIEELMQVTSQWLMLQTDFQHLIRIENLRKDYEKNKNSISGSYYAEMLHSTCVSNREYNPRVHPELLVFEYLSQMRLRKQQVQIIEKMLSGTESYNDAVAQLIMGGGKTSVLATVLLVLAAEKGLSLFVTPASQFSTVKENLSQSMKQCFNRELMSLEVERSELDDLQTVTSLYRSLDEATRLGKPIIAKPETLQMLELEFVTRSDKLAQTVQAGNSVVQKDLEILKSLARIGNLLQDQGHVLIDEVDLVLDTLKEVNFPGGTVNTLTPDRVEVIRETFAIMVDPSVRIEIDGSKKRLKDVIKAHLILQGEFDVEYFKKQIIPVIAAKLADKLPSMKLPTEELENSFVKFACGLMEEPLEDKNDRDFFEYIKKLNASTNNADVDASNQIALAKHILQDVLTTTLTKSCGRHFGRTRGTPAGKVVPYQGVDTPSTSEFGYHIEAACYQFLTSMQTGIQASQIAQLANVMTESATKTAERTNKPFNQTPEAIEFLEITGIELNEAKFEDKLESAVAKLEAERARGIFSNILKIEAETVLTCVNFHAHRVSSGPQSFLSMFKSRRAFSGTPWNVETYPASMKSDVAYIKDLGTEGQIIATMLERGKKNSLVHSIASPSPVEMIEKVMQCYSDKPERVSMLLDPCGLFKGKDNKQIAFSVRDYLKSQEKLEKAFKGVLFFTRPPKGQERDLFSPMPLEIDAASSAEDAQASPDTLAFLPMGSDTLIYIKGTSVHELEKHGLRPGDYFVIDDERHTTGTDIRMTPDAVAVMTTDESLTKPRMCQAIMRLRQYLYTQDLHVILLEETLKKRGITEPSIHDVIAMSNRAQALQKYKITERSFNQKIDNFFRAKALGMIRRSVITNNANEIYRVTSAMRAFMTYEMQDEPYQQFGHPDHDLNTLASLSERFDRRLSLYKAALAKLGSPDPTNWETEKKLILKEAQECRFLPQTVKKVVSEVTGVEQEVELVAEVEVAEEVDQSIENENEILKDLEEIARVSSYGQYKQSPWNDNKAKGFIEAVRAGITAGGQADFNRWGSYISLFLENHKGLSYQKKGFHEALASSLMCTKNFQYTTLAPLPMFHPKLRDPNRMLLIKRADNSFVGVLLSLEEAQFWQENINKHKQPNIWLLDPSGHSLVESVSALPQDQNDVKLLLVQMNALLGNVEYLNHNKAATASWLSQKPRAKIDLVKYAVLSRGDAFQRKCFAESEIFNLEQAERLRRNRTRLMAHLQSKRENVLSAEKVQAMSAEEIALLDDEESIRLVSPEQVNWLMLDKISLLIDPEQIQALDEERVKFISADMVCHLTESQVPHLGQDTSKLLKLTSSQANFVTTEQLSFLSKEVIASLTKPELISALGASQLAHIKKTQVAHLKASQIPHIPLKEEIIHAITKVELFDSATEKQLDLISDSQFALINTPSSSYSVISKMGAKYADQLLHSLVSYLERKEAIQALTEDRINAIAFSNVEKLSDGQLKQLTKGTLISRIQNPSILAKLDLANVGPHLSADQLNLLPLEEIARLPARSSILEYLDEDHFGALSKEQIQLLNNARLVGRLTKEQTKHLSRDQFKYLSETQVFDLEGDAINVISPERVNNLRAEQISYLNEAALVQRLDADHVNYIAPEPHLIELLTDAQLGHLTKKELVALVKPEKFGFLCSEAIEQLSNEQLCQIQPGAPVLEHIKANQVQALSNDVIRSLDREDLLDHMQDSQLALVSKELFKKLPVSRIQKIQDSDLLDLLSEEQLQSVKEEQLAFASDTLLAKLPSSRLADLGQNRVSAIQDVSLVALLTDAQLNWLSQNLIQNLDTPEQIKRLRGAQVHRLNQTQVAHLDQAQLSSLNGNQVPWITNVQVKLLPESHIKYLTRPQACFVEPTMIPHLSNDAVNGILAENLAYITQDQAYGLSESHLISKLPAERVNDIQPLAVAHLSHEQLSHLTKESLIQAVECSDEKINALNPDVFNLLSQQQILSIKDQALLDKLSGSTLKMLSPAQVKCLKNKEQICQLVSPQVDQIDASCIEYLTELQLSLLTDKALIQSITDESKLQHVANRQNLTVEQLESLVKIGKEDLIPEDRFDELSSDTIPSLKPESVSHLMTLRALEALSNDQLNYLSPEQVAVASSGAQLAKRLPDGKLCFVPSNKVHNLSMRQMGRLTAQSQVRSIPTGSLAEALSEHQLPLLSSSQVGALKNPEWVKKLPPAMSYGLSQDMWQHMTMTQIKEFMKSDFVIGSGEQSAAFLSRIPPKFFENLPFRAISSASFMKNGTPEQKQRISPKLIKNSQLPKAVLPHLLPEHMEYIDSSLCPHVKGDGVAYLNDAMLDRASPEQVQSVRSQHAVNHLCKRAPQHIEFLKPAQIMMIKKAGDLRYFDKNQLPYLDSNLVKNLPMTTLWSQPTTVLKKCSFLQKATLFTGLFIQGWVLSLSCIAFTCLLFPLAFLSSVRNLIRSAWSPALYSWRCFNIF